MTNCVAASSARARPLRAVTCSGAVIGEVTPVGRSGRGVHGSGCARHRYGTRVPLVKDGHEHPDRARHPDVTPAARCAPTRGATASASSPRPRAAFAEQGAAAQMDDVARAGRRRGRDASTATSPRRRRCIGELVRRKFERDPRHGARGARGRGPVGGVRRHAAARRRDAGRGRDAPRRARPHARGMGDVRGRARRGRRRRGRGHRPRPGGRRAAPRLRRRRHPDAHVRHVRRHGHAAGPRPGLAPAPGGRPRRTARCGRSCGHRPAPPPGAHREDGAAGTSGPAQARLPGACARPAAAGSL